MGAALSVPMPELSRHAKHRSVPHRPRPHCNRRKQFAADAECPQQGWEQYNKKAAAHRAGSPGERLRHGITPQEVSRHCSPHDAWVVLRGRVYDMTTYLRYHPGGAAVLLKVAGRDGTALFDKYHPWVKEDAHLESCLVGWVSIEAEHSMQSSSCSSDTWPIATPQPPQLAQPQPQQPQSHPRAHPAVGGEFEGGEVCTTTTTTTQERVRDVREARDEGQYMFTYRPAQQLDAARCEFRGMPPPPPPPPSGKGGQWARGGQQAPLRGGMGASSELETPLLGGHGTGGGGLQQGWEASEKVRPSAGPLGLMVQACSA